MWCKYSIEELVFQVEKQLNNFWNVSFSQKDIESMKRTMQRVEQNFVASNNKYYRNDEGIVTFHVENSVQYAIFLYYFSNQLYLDKNEELAEYIYYLNKMMNLVEWFYAVSLPDVFGSEHPLSTVLGRAEYQNYFFCYQGLTVGGNWKNDILHYPTIGEDVVMYANSTVLGNSKIGNHVIISANTYIKDEIIPDNSMVFGQSPNLVIKHRNNDDVQSDFCRIWRK